MSAAIRSEAPQDEGAATGFPLLRSGLRDQHDRGDETIVTVASGPAAAQDAGQLRCLGFEYFAGRANRLVDAARNVVTVDEPWQPPDAPKDAGPAAHARGDRWPQHAHPETRTIFFDAARAPFRPSGHALLAGTLRVDTHTTVDQLHGQLRSARHDARHDRRWLRVGQDYLLLLDDLRAPTAHDYRLHLNVDPAAAPRTDCVRTDDGCVFDAGELRVCIRQASRAAPGTVVSTHDVTLHDVPSVDPQAPGLAAHDAALDEFDHERAPRRPLQLNATFPDSQPANAQRAEAPHAVAQDSTRRPPPRLVAHFRAANTTLASVLSTAPERALQPRLRPASTRDWHDMAGIGRYAARGTCEHAPQLWRVELPGIDEDVYDVIGLAAIDDIVAGTQSTRAWQVDRLRIASRWLVARFHRGRTCALWLPDDAERLS